MLDDPENDEKIKSLLDMSYEMTRRKKEAVRRLKSMSNVTHK